MTKTDIAKFLESTTWHLRRQRTEFDHACRALSQTEPKPDFHAWFDEKTMESLLALAERCTLNGAPIPMRLPCPGTVPDEHGRAKPCGELHIDVGEFATKPHHTHSCQACGMTWRPAVEHTVGVRFLPGFKNEEPTGETP